ncbi:MAG TPA: ABC transporter substrate-binding protein, partial [Xanthobacteraceae bacterium]|nr:ABC transporter substrate-binding protein [Xanthobacteraceae bacterium]
PYMIRTSVTLPQVMETFGTWAATKGGIKQSYTMVTDYGPGHDSESAFQSAFKAAGGTIIGSVRFPVANPDFFSIGGYDGMHAIYEALKKTNGNTDGDALIAAAKGLKWESPRGPMSIDPDTRDVVQTIYIRRVEKVGGELVNVPFDKIENVKDPSRARGG